MPHVPELPAFRAGAALYPERIQRDRAALRIGVILGAAGGRNDGEIICDIGRRDHRRPVGETAVAGQPSWVTRVV